MYISFVQVFLFMSASSDFLSTYPLRFSFSYSVAVVLFSLLFSFIFITFLQKCASKNSSAYPFINVFVNMENPAIWSTHTKHTTPFMENRRLKLVINSAQKYRAFLYEQMSSYAAVFLFLVLVFFFLLDR